MVRRWARRPRGEEVPGLLLYSEGYSADEVEAIRQLVDECDGDYNALTEKLSEMGATETDFKAVNRAAKDEMGKSSSDMDLCDPDEVETWRQGYKGTRQNIDDLSKASETTSANFKKAKRNTGWRLFR